jgi:hypothetical protein
MPQQGLLPMERIERAILVLRGHKVMLDADLAALYGIETKVLVRAVKRNQERSPGDFMFQLSQDEFEVPSWHLKLLGWPAVPALRLHRTECPPLQPKTRRNCACIW